MGGSYGELGGAKLSTYQRYRVIISLKYESVLPSLMVM